MAGLRDLWLGRLRLVTYDNQFQEGVGNELQVTGGSAALGARKPKRYAMSLPIHGAPGDTNQFLAGQRMRRQVRALLENDQTKAQGLYLQAWLDPEQNGWLMIGSGTIAYAAGGVTMADYTLTLDEVYRVASDRAYRPARRLEVYDRRLSTTPRDFMGSRYSTDFAGLTGGVYAASAGVAWLPPNATDVSGLARSLATTFPVFCQEGFAVAVQGQGNGTVLSFEQPPTKRQSGDVVIWDRQGQGNWTPPYQNLDGSLPGNQWTGVPRASPGQGPYGWVNPIINPSAENGTTGWTLTGTGGTLASTFTTALGDDPLPPGASFDVTVSGVTASSLAPSNTGSSGSGLPVTSGQSVYVEGWVKPLTLPAGATISLNVALYNAAGALLSQTVVQNVASTAIRVGQWYRLAGTYTIPAGTAATAVPTLTTQGRATTDTVRYRADNLLITDATALGSPPAYNPPGFPNTRYFDGGSARSGWMGAQNVSQSVQWLDPQDQPGWEEVYGTEHPLNQSDVPVIGNSICRVRAEQGAMQAGSPVLAFAVDLAVGPAGQGGGGWQEQGRWTFDIGGMPVWAHLASVAVVEWTPDRGVVKVSLTGLSGPARADLYITLQRGWSGPRFEVYYLPAASATLPSTLVCHWSPVDASGPPAVAARKDGYTAGVGSNGIAGDLGVGNYGVSNFLEPWVTVLPGAGGLPVCHLLRERDDPSFYWVSLVPSTSLGLYPSGTHGRVDTSFGQPGSGNYLTQQLAFGLPGAMIEAESVRNAGSSTTSIVTDSTASGGQAVGDSQAAESVKTLILPAGMLATPGSYALFARVRGSVGDMLTFRWGGYGDPSGRLVGSDGAISAFGLPVIYSVTSTTWAWIYVGEVNTTQAGLASTAFLDAWVSFRAAGNTGSAAIVDLVVLVPTQRSAAGTPLTFDGARDQAAQMLVDTRAFAEVVQR